MILAVSSGMTSVMFSTMRVFVVGAKSYVVVNDIFRQNVCR